MFMRMKLLVPQCLSMEIGESLSDTLSMMILGIPLGIRSLRIDNLIDNIELYLHNAIMINLGIYMMKQVMSLGGLRWMHNSLMVDQTQICFFNWLANLEDYLDCYGMTNSYCGCFAKMKLTGSAKCQWQIVFCSLTIQVKTLSQCGKKIKIRLTKKKVLSSKSFVRSTMESQANYIFQ